MLRASRAARQQRSSFRLREFALRRPADFINKMQGHRSRIPRGCTGLGRAYGMHAGAFGASSRVRCGSKMRKIRIEHILSAYHPVATAKRTFRIGRFVPTRTHAPQQDTALFHHLVGAGKMITRAMLRRRRAE